jgi:cytoskeletal protein RodZ
MRKISDILKESREEKKLTLADVEATTHIKRRFLVAIEEGRFRDLPSESYAMGFVKSYAQYLDIPTTRAVALFKREYAGDKQEVIPEFRKKQHTYKKTKIFDSRFMLIGFAAALIIGYIALQYKSFILGPELVVTSPQNGSEIRSSIVEIRGKTDPYATVLIDNDDTYVSIDGTFKKSIYVFSGEKKISVVAKNRFGKMSQQTVTVNVK